MFGRRNEVVNTEADIKIIKLNDEMYHAKHSLEAAVRKVIITIGCVDLYPEGKDKQIARLDAEQAKKVLQNCITLYDSTWEAYEQALATPLEKRATTENYVRFVSSHEIVEIFFKNFYENR